MEMYYLSFDSDSYGNMMVGNSHPVIVQKTHLIPLIYRLSTQFSSIKYVKSTKCMNYTVLSHNSRIIVEKKAFQGPFSNSSFK
jgi:hypothetical protein